VTSGPDLRSSETPLKPVAPYEYRYDATRRGRLGRRIRRAARGLVGTLVVVLVAAALTYAALLYLGHLETALVLGVEDSISAEEEIMRRGP
jgi:hypothetical protein